MVKDLGCHPKEGSHDSIVKRKLEVWSMCCGNGNTSGNVEDGIG